ncbi:beta family protein [Bradyrhizobium sp. HKCCYLRH2060]|uniref:beta family protein n=1 Tax=Bradyrhizobium sp. HKCCYLRH2060 TaxID=3420743 RepID=UPI003EB74229
MPAIATFRHTDCLAIMKWKQGERAALSTYSASASRLHVLFEIPPAGDYDQEKQRPLTPTEHIRLFGKRLCDAWGNRVVFIDAGYIDDERHKEGFPRHPLTELIERARTAGALACPAISPSHSTEYVRAVKRFVEWNPGYPVCVRVQAKHLDSPTFQADLESLIRDLRCRPSDCFLVLDFRALDAPTSEAEDQFVENLADRLAEMPFLHDWSGLAVALSSFPAEIKMKPGQVKEFPRTDLSVYKKLIQNRKVLLRTPMFGDYALDTSPIVKPQRRTPSAQLRYSTPNQYAVAKGTTVKKPFGYESIFPVADLLTSQSFFMGKEFSAGDAFIVGLQERPPATGSASTWRWASTDHHLTCNLRWLSELYGLRVADAKVESEPYRQLEFTYAESPSTAPEASDNRNQVSGTKDGRR